MGRILSDTYCDARKNRVIVLEELNFVWDEEELTDLTFLWTEGRDIIDISDYFKRDPDEVMLALIHLAKAEKISRRKGGLFGGFID